MNINNKEHYSSIRLHCFPSLFQLNIVKSITSIYCEEGIKVLYLRKNRLQFKITGFDHNFVTESVILN